MGLPSTVLGTHGWVQYYCKAALREPNGLTHKNQQVFIVMNPIDLNLEPPVLAVSIVIFILVLFYEVYFFFIFTLYPAPSRVSRGNLVLKHFVPHSEFTPPNSEDIACCVAELNAAL